jgi:DNA-binding PadR family transcriptional regulator
VDRAVARIELTELEACVLGAIWRRGSCSAYAVRREFAESPSSHWSASAGSIYPTIRRLRGLGLVAASPDPSDRRGTHELVVTPEGERTFKAWVGELPDWTAKPTRDAIRSRMNFLDALGDRRAQLAFTTRAEAQARAQITVLKGRLEKARTISEAEGFVTLGSLHELYGRLRWLRIVKRELGRRRA